MLGSNQQVVRLALRRSRRAPCCKGAAKPKPSSAPEAWVMESVMAVSSVYSKDGRSGVSTSEKHYLLIQRSLPRQPSAGDACTGFPEPH